MAGIRDVARAAGVSTSTVSNVLNGRDHRMRPETKARVLDAIARLDYRPNVSARQLKSGRSGAIGLIVPSTSNPFWGAVAHHVERAAVGQGYSVLICNAERDPETELRYAETLLAMGVRGVILASAPVSVSHFARLVDAGMVIAAFDRLREESEDILACSVSVNQELACALATQHLVGLGHRRIAFLSGPIRTSSRRRRQAGIMAALARARIPFDPTLVWQGGRTSSLGDIDGSQLGRVGIRELLSRDDPPTAVITVNDMFALGAYAGARDLGFRIPEDLSIVGFDDIVLAEIVQPPLTTIRQPIDVMADLIVRRLARCLEEQDCGAEDEAHVELNTEIIIRASTAPPRGMAALSGVGD